MGMMVAAGCPREFRNNVGKVRFRTEFIKNTRENPELVLGRKGPEKQLVPFIVLWV